MFLKSVFVVEPIGSRGPACLVLITKSDRSKTLYLALTMIILSITTRGSTSLTSVDLNPDWLNEVRQCVELDLKTVLFQPLSTNHAVRKCAFRTFRTLFSGVVPLFVPSLTLVNAILASATLIFTSVHLSSHISYAVAGYWSFVLALHFVIEGKTHLILNIWSQIEPDHGSTF